MTTNLQYAITRKTPANQKALKWALQAQTLLNETSVLQQDHLNLALIGGATERPAMNFPFVQIAPMRIGPYAAQEPFGESGTSHNANAVAAGATKVRDLWSAHVVAAYLRVVSEMHPELTIELRDDSGQFVIPMAVFIRGGRLELNREVLNASRERAIETVGDPQAGVPFLWAESRALNGEFLMDVPVSDYMEVPQIVFDKDEHYGATVGELALHHVRSVLAKVTSVAA